jgi:3-polyprenyl-4-hydroxybenzoate decarboxylase
MADEGTTPSPDRSQAAAVQDIAQAVARFVASGAGTSNATDGISAAGSFTISITIGGNIFTLTVTTTPVAFTISTTPVGGGTTETILGFTYTDTTDWVLTAGLSTPVAFGNVAIGPLSLTITDKS